MILAKSLNWVDSGRRFAKELGKLQDSGEPLGDLIRRELGEPMLPDEQSAFMVGMRIGMFEVLLDAVKSQKYGD